MSNLDAKERRDLNQLRRNVKKLEAQVPAGGQGNADAAAAAHPDKERVRRFGRLRSDVKKLEGVEGAEVVLEQKQKEAQQVRAALFEEQPISV